MLDMTIDDACEVSIIVRGTRIQMLSVGKEEMLDNPKDRDGDGDCLQPLDAANASRMFSVCVLQLR